MATRSPRGPRRGASRPGPSGTRGGRSSTPAPAQPKAASAGSGRQLTTRAIVLVAVVLLLIASYTSTLHAWWEQRADIQQTKALIASTEQSILDLKDQKKRWDDQAYVKQQAKERFGWVLPGEVGYRVIGSNGKLQGADVPQLDAPAKATSPEWYDKLWGSVKESGKNPAAKTTTNEPNPDKVLKDK